MSYEDLVTVAELTDMLSAFKPDKPVKVLLVDRPEDDNLLLHFAPPMATVAAEEPVDGDWVESRQGETGGMVVVALRVVRGDEST